MNEHAITPHTEYRELADVVGVPRLFLKREDLHPYGSHKGRSIPTMIDLKAARGATTFAISSSGNAALAAIRHIQKLNAGGANLSLAVLVGMHIDAEKERTLLSEARDARITVEKHERPVQELLKRSKTGVQSLRQSTDDEALVGYAELARELSSIPELSDVFIGTSSGTSAEAMAAYFDGKALPVAVHIVQTSEHAPLASELGAEKPEPEASLATAVVDKVAHRRSSLVPLLQKTGGAGWIVSNSDIRRAQELMKKAASVEATGNGALALAGLLKARHSGKVFKGSVACIVTGR